MEGSHGLALLENLDEVGAGGEAAFQGDVLDGEGGAPQQRLGVVQAHGDKVVVGGEAGLLFEDAQEVKLADGQAVTYIGQIQIRLEFLFEKLYGTDYHGGGAV